MSWFWMNVPLAAVFFVACSGVPLYMVLTHPTWGPRPADSREPTVVEQLLEANRGQVLPPGVEVDAPRS
jgi:hypothetical protein